MARISRSASWLLALLPAGALLVACMRQRIVLVTVEGMSMQPAFRPGDRVIVHRCPSESLTVGDVVVLEAPRKHDSPGHSLQAEIEPSGRHWYLKRVAALPGDLVP